MSFQETKNNFIELTRAYSLPISAAPWFVATAIAAVSTNFYSAMPAKFFNTFLTFFAIVCIHLGVNLLDDYFDIKKKLKEGIPLNKIKFEEKARLKARLIIDGTYSIKQVKLILTILFGIGAITGLYFTFLYGIIIPVIAAIAGVLCLFYPFSSKLCLSEIVVGVIFGPLLMAGTYTALTGLYSERLLILSAAVALMVIVLLDAHNLMDFDFDKRTGKKTLVTLTGSKKRALLLIALEILTAYAIVTYLAVSGRFSYWILLSIFITAPLAIKLIMSLNDYNNVKDVKFIPKWYLGPMENWDIIKKEGFEYFMYRFYIARNLGFIFCIILAIACFCTIKINYIYI